MITHRVDGVRRFAARTGDPRIVEEDYGTPLRKPVRHKRIPVVKAATEVLKEDKRDSAFRAKAPVRVADSISLDKAGWSRDMGASRHIYLHGYPFGMLRLQLSVNPEDAAFQFARQDATTRDGKSIGRWCWRYFGISRRDQLRLQFGYYQYLWRSNCGAGMGGGNRRCKKGSS